MAPAGGHSNQAGTLLDRAAVPVPEEPPDAPPADDVLAAVPVVFGRAPEEDVVVEVAAVDEVLLAVVEFVCAVVVIVGKVTAP